MLRHFLNATARTSSRSLFTKHNPLFSGGLNFVSSAARTSSRSLPVEPKVYVLSLRALSGQKLCASEMQSQSGQKAVKAILILALGLSFVNSIIAGWSQAPIPESTMDRPPRQLTSIVPLATSEPDLREWTRANMEFKMIDRRGSEMPPSTYFWSKAIVAPETMPKLKEILDDLKSDGARVEESDNYYFVEATDGWKKKRFAELMIWLEEPGHKYFRVVEEREKIREKMLEEKRRTLDSAGYMEAWHVGSEKKPSGLPETRRMDGSCFAMDS